MPRKTVTPEHCASIDAIFVAAHCRSFPGRGGRGSRPRQKDDRQVGRKRAAQIDTLALKVPDLYIHPPGTPGQMEYPIRYEVRDVSKLVTSHKSTQGFQPDSRYPDGTQERDYQRQPAEQVKVAQLAAQMIPALMLSRAVSAAEGPPIVTRKGNIVLSGNGRTMGLALAYDRFPQSGERYKEAAQAFANQIGLTIPRGTRNPVVVRVVDLDPAGEEARAFALAANNRLGAERSEVRRASAIANAIPDDLVLSTLDQAETLGDITSGSRGSALRRALYESPTLPASEKNALFHPDGRLTDTGRSYLARALAIKALGTVEAVEALVDSPSLLNTLQGALAYLLRIRRAAERGEILPRHDLTGQLRGAVAYYDEWIRPNGYELDDGGRWRDFFRQRHVGDLAPPRPTDEVRMGLELLAKYRGKPRLFRGFASQYLTEAIGERVDVTGIFGDHTPRTFRELVTDAERVTPLAA